ncbi:GNAT family N-acetyltransferase [Helicobacter sp. 12S02232-10]|uniref:N-acetyltransferase n=1 Tax=Helicobacter sp. 12S02232-10 TaxID=1476197 RepID=UPI000BA505D9|nr:N-acetyltransferase [Helicobacter sp. 12S02232-10]PAF47704.1 GNAT family N-acetyltransferase [Helicobacter sp. 12S02232-10]
MCAMVAEEVQKGLILPRSPEEMATSIRSYFIAKQSENIVGFCALHIYSPTLGEVRSLVVNERYRRQGIARKLVDSVLSEGGTLGLKEFLVLTYCDGLFRKLGFEVIEKSLLPDHKIWADCIKCKRFPICEEIALLKKL